MKKTNQILVVVSCFVLFAMLLVGCSSHKALWGNEKDGFVLTYRLAPGESLSYASNGTEKMSLMIMGSDQSSTTTTKNNYTITAKKAENDNLNTTVTIDEFVRDSSSPQGDTSIDTTPIVGKDFELILSPFGKELKHIGIEDLKIDMGPQGGGMQDVLNFYRSVLPDLPDHPVKIGDSWVAEEEFTGPAGNLEVTVKTENIHTLAGLETVDGIECLKVSSAIKSTITGEGEQDGNDLDLSSEATGTGTWYFAYKKGLFIKSEGTSDMQGTIDVSGSFEFSIPMTQETNSMTQLIKK